MLFCLKLSRGKCRLSDVPVETGSLALFLSASASPLETESMNKLVSYPALLVASTSEENRNNVVVNVVTEQVVFKATLGQILAGLWRPEQVF